MGKINNHLNIANLISKEQLGIINENELSQLNSWREENSNLELCKEIIERKGVEERKKVISATNLDNEWSRFKQNQKGARIKSFRITALKYAAVLMPIIFVAYFFVFLSDLPKESTKKISRVIVPGESKAELVLSNGIKVDLSKRNDYRLKETNGINIKNVKNELSYSKDSAISNEKPLFNTINIPKGGEYVVTLSDGTKVWVNSMSSLKYPVSFGKNKRVVELSGEAFFEVTKDKSRPFIVKMKGYNVKVLGTSFNISSYEDEDCIHTTLATGKVEIYGLNGKTSEKYRIVPGEQFVLNKNTRKIDVKEVDVKVFTSWKDGYFMFDETRFEDVLLELQRWYGIEVFYRNNDKKEVVFSGKLPRFENLNYILDMMKKIGDIKYRLKGNVLYIE